MADYHVKALELAKANQWDASHTIIQQYDDAFSCNIHALLHRVEGDLSNARYWYQRAGTQMPASSVQDEMNDLLRVALSMD